MSNESRIYFLNNPYPKGHLLEEFTWSGRLEPDTGIWFDLHLKTKHYYDEDESGDSEEVSNDWNAKIVWANFNSCILSSTFWNDNAGILIGTKRRKLDFQNLVSEVIEADKLPRPKSFDINEDPPFHIYLLGHDDCAEHKIQFTNSQKTGFFDIKWNGKIALAYAGDYEFKYDFDAKIYQTRFDGIRVPAGISKMEIEDLLKHFVSDPDLFVLNEREGKLILNNISQYEV